MARCLLIWELGGGLGHIVPLARVARALLDRGHEVHVALRERSLATRLPDGISVWQSPHAHGAREDHLATYADLLAASGFASVASLEENLRKWDQLFQSIRPDLILFEHAPTAMLAAVGTGIPSVAYGNGFYLPVPGGPLPILRNWLLTEAHAAKKRERQVLDVVNEVLHRRGRTFLLELSDLYGTADLTLLATYPELSHFGERSEANYCGIPPDVEPTEAVAWPTAEGPRLLLYLRPCPETEQVIAAVQRLGWPALVVGGPASMPNRAGNIQFLGRLPSLQPVAATCSLAICHAGHGTTAEVLLAGKPLLFIPQHCEQMLLTIRCVQQSLAACYIPGGKETCEDAIARAAATTELQRGAEAFAGRHAPHRKFAFERVITEITLRARRGVGGTLSSAGAASNNRVSLSEGNSCTDRLDDEFGTNRFGSDVSARPGGH